MTRTHQSADPTATHVAPSEKRARHGHSNTTNTHKRVKRSKSPPKTTSNDIHRTPSCSTCGGPPPPLPSSRGEDTKKNNYYHTTTTTTTTTPPPPPSPPSPPPILCFSLAHPLSRSAGSASKDGKSSSSACGCSSCSRSRSWTWPCCSSASRRCCTASPTATGDGIRPSFRPPSGTGGGATLLSPSELVPSSPAALPSFSPWASPSSSPGVADAAGTADVDSAAGGAAGCSGAEVAVQAPGSSPWPRPCPSPRGGTETLTPRRRLL